MVECRRNTCFVEQFCDFLGAAATAGINDGRALHALKNMDKFLALIGSPPYHISQVLALKGHLIDVKSFSPLSRGRL